MVVKIPLYTNTESKNAHDTILYIQLTGSIYSYQWNFQCALSLVTGEIDQHVTSQKPPAQISVAAGEELVLVVQNPRYAGEQNRSRREYDAPDLPVLVAVLQHAENLQRLLLRVLESTCLRIGGGGGGGGALV